MMSQGYITVKDLVIWLWKNADLDAIVCSSEEGNGYPIDLSNLYVDKEGWNGHPAVYIGIN